MEKSFKSLRQALVPWVALSWLELAPAAARAAQAQIVISSWNILRSAAGQRLFLWYRRGYQQRGWLQRFRRGYHRPAEAATEAGIEAVVEALIVQEQPGLCSMAEAGGPDSGCGKNSGKLLRSKIYFRHIFIFSIEYLQPPESLILIQSSWGRQQQQGGRRKG